MLASLVSNMIERPSRLENGRPSGHDNSPWDCSDRTKNIGFPAGSRDYINGKSAQFVAGRPTFADHPPVHYNQRQALQPPPYGRKGLHQRGAFERNRKPRNNMKTQPFQKRAHHRNNRPNRQQKNLVGYHDRSGAQQTTNNPQRFNRIIRSYGSSDQTASIVLQRRWPLETKNSPHSCPTSSYSSPPGHRTFFNPKSSNDSYRFNAQLVDYPTRPFVPGEYIPTSPALPWMDNDVYPHGAAWTTDEPVRSQVTPCPSTHTMSMPLRSSFNNHSKREQERSSQAKPPASSNLSPIPRALEYDPRQPQYSPLYDPDPFRNDAEYDPAFPSWYD